jgi:hypothetical protein
LKDAKRKLERELKKLPLKTNCGPEDHEENLIKAHHERIAKERSNMLSLKKQVEVRPNLFLISAGKAKELGVGEPGSALDGKLSNEKLR